MSPAFAAPSRRRFCASIAGNTIQRILAKGDVLTLLGKDAGGTQIVADRPIQAISVLNSHGGLGGWFHTEEVMLPLETWGKHHVIASGTDYGGAAQRQGISIQGVADNTTLTYLPAKPEGCPETIQAGENIVCGDQFVYPMEMSSESFEIHASHSIGVMLLHAGDTQSGNGDVAASASIPAEQFQTRYQFAAPPGEIVYADVIAPIGTRLTLDGNQVQATAQVVSPNYVVARVKIDVNNSGLHRLEAPWAFGVQLVGYGNSITNSASGKLSIPTTSSQTPAAINLQTIAP